ncbi:uncharacterized protein LOC122076427 [Macadamia integrifolia]|uniref:uncharacterized protein LOC122076427 n=1 Tax=Macadamia integrifolia TaxID=60698 RepID=UPI001C4F4D6E|nr:uncharacterized protein LOC122076427 [Macadamia integrifolia]
MMVHEILNGHADRCYQEFRMERHVFENLCRLMVHRGWLKDSRYLRVDEQLALFLFIVGKGASNRDAQERFQRSDWTISQHFGMVLKAMRSLAKERIRPPSFNRIPIEIASNPKQWPFFKDCIGAIDGSHVHAIVPREDQTRYRNRKGITTQNVMCICSFDMHFTYVNAGWEGSANDC